MRHSCERFTQHRYQRGFTLIEAIAVLLIIAIISVVVIVKATSTSTYKLASETQTLKTNLRYAQSRAMSDETSWGLALTGTSYTIQNSGGTVIPLPDESSATHTMLSGVTLSGAATVTFNKWGSPGSATLSIILSAGGEPPSTITVTRETGFIQ